MTQMRNILTAKNFSYMISDAESCEDHDETKYSLIEQITAELWTSAWMKLKSWKRNENCDITNFAIES